MNEITSNIVEESIVEGVYGSIIPESIKVHYYEFMDYVLLQRSLGVTVSLLGKIHRDCGYPSSQVKTIKKTYRKMMSEVLKRLKSGENPASIKADFPRLAIGLSKLGVPKDYLLYKVKLDSFNRNIRDLGKSIDKVLKPLQIPNVIASAFTKAKMVLNVNIDDPLYSESGRINKLFATIFREEDVELIKAETKNKAQNIIYSWVINIPSDNYDKFVERADKYKCIVTEV